LHHQDHFKKEETIVSHGRGKIKRNHAIPAGTRTVETIVSHGRGKIKRNHAIPAGTMTEETPTTSHNKPGSRPEKGQRSEVRREDTKAPQRETTTKADRPLVKVNGVPAKAKDPPPEIGKLPYVGKLTTTTSPLRGSSLSTSTQPSPVHTIDTDGGMVLVISMPLVALVILLRTLLEYFA